MTTKPMYAAIANSPETELAKAISEKDTEITVLSTSGLPAPPNLLTVGLDETAETVRYVKIDGNKLTVERGFQGKAKSWSQGTKIARHYTAYDHDAFMTNIQGLSTEVSAAYTKLAEVKQRHKVCDDDGTTIDLPAGTDLNTLIKTGFYTGEKTVNGPPSLGAIWMYIEVVAGSSTNVLQKAYGLFSSTTCYIRRKPKGSLDWTAWIAMATEKDIAEVKQLAIEGKTKAEKDIQTLGQKVSEAKEHANTAAKQAETNAKAHTDTKLAEVKQRHKVCADNGDAIYYHKKDVNTVRYTGFYTLSSPINAPALVSNIAYMVVIRYPNDVMLQKLYDHGADKAYIRRFNGTWQPWIAMATEKDIDGVKQLAIEGKTKVEKDIQTLGQKVSEAKEHANTAAKQAETNAKAHTDTKLAEVKQRHKVCEDDGDAIYYHKKDVNTVRYTGFYTLSSPINAPALVSNIAYMVVIRYPNDVMLQKLYDHGADKAYIRRFTGTTWQLWVAMATEKDIAEVDKKLAEVKQSGVELKKKLVDAINAKGVKVSASEEFSALISKVGEIREVGMITVDAKYFSIRGKVKEFVIAVIPSGTEFAKFDPELGRGNRIGVQVEWKNPQDTVTNAASLRTGCPKTKLVLKDAFGNTVDIYTGPSAITFREGEYAYEEFPLKEFRLSPKLYPNLNFDKEIKLVAQLPLPPSHWRIKDGFSYLYIHGTIIYY